MARYVIDEEAFRKFISDKFETAKRVKEKAKNKDLFEAALIQRVKEECYGDILIKMDGNAYQDPKTVEQGGFMREVQVSYECTEYGETEICPNKKNVLPLLSETG